MSLEVIEARCPHRAVGREPSVHCPKRLRSHAVEPPLSVAADVDHPGLAEDPQMLGHRRLTQSQLADELADGPLLSAQEIEDLPAVGFSQDLKS
jgi:hypothetical protein